MVDGGTDGLALRFRPLRRAAPFGRVVAGDRDAQVAGARTFRVMRRWRCVGAAWVTGTVAVSLVALWTGRPVPLPGWTALVLAVAGGVTWRARRAAARRRLRSVDAGAGFPVPRDLVPVLGAAAEPLLALCGWIALAERGLDPQARQVLRASRADVHAVEIRMFADLHRARLAWVAGDAAGWRRAVLDAAASARRAHAVYADVRSCATLPPPDTPATPA